jgi:hypothetical protein
MEPVKLFCERYLKDTDGYVSLSLSRRTYIHSVKIEQESKTYRCWTALRLAKEDVMSPRSPLEDKFLQKASSVSA